MDNESFESAGGVAPPRDGTAPDVNKSYVSIGAVQVDIKASSDDNAVWFGMNF